MADPRNDKMTELKSELKNYLDKLKSHVLSDEEYEKHEREDRARKLEQRKLLARTFIKEYGGPRTYEALKKKNWIETEIVQALRKLEPGGCAFIQSQPGAGKTVAAFHYLARRICQDVEPRKVAYVNALDLTFAHRDYAVLAIDDVGVDYASQLWLTAFAGVINFRHQHRLTTVLLTNLILKDWAQRYDKVEEGQEFTGRIFSRIAQWAREPGSVFLESDAESLRTHNRAKAQE